ncbi:MAG: hypothetical protein QME79_02555 [Bacillota bacterium]|nr:hypothetical protein [Bacillota bacterium]
MTETRPPEGQPNLAAQFPHTFALLKSLSLPKEVSEGLRNAPPPDPKTMQSIMALAQVIEKALSQSK